MCHVAIGIGLGGRGIIVTRYVVEVCRDSVYRGAVWLIVIRVVCLLIGFIALVEGLGFCSSA